MCSSSRSVCCPFLLLHVFAAICSLDLSELTVKKVMGKLRHVKGLYVVFIALTHFLTV